MNKVTVIIPNYNGLQFMEPCFAALDRQNYRDFDVLVVDNGSEDGSREWLEEKGIPTIFLEQQYRFFRGSECGDTVCGYALCHSVK